MQSVNFFCDVLAILLLGKYTRPMSTDREKLLNRIERFCLRHHMAETTFGRLVKNDTALVSRIRNGRNIGIRTVERINCWMRDYTPDAAERQKKADAVAA